MTRKSRHYDTEARTGITKTGCTKPRETLGDRPSQLHQANEVKTHGTNLFLRYRILSPSDGANVTSQYSKLVSDILNAPLKKTSCIRYSLKQSVGVVCFCTQNQNVLF